MILGPIEPIRRRRRLFEQQSWFLRLVPFAASLGGAVVLYPLGPDVHYGAETGLAAVLIAATLATVVVVPWRRLDPAAQVLPLLLFLATVAVLRDAHGGAESGYSPLVLVPVVWAALFAGPRVLALIVVAAGLTIALPAVFSSAPIYPAGEIRRALFMTFVGGAVAWLVQRLIGLVDREIARREQAEQALARIRASQIHDDIVQSLTAARLGLALGDQAAVEAGVTRALTCAQQVVSDLIAEGEPIVPGSLRRNR